MCFLINRGEHIGKLGDLAQGAQCGLKTRRDLGSCQPIEFMLQFETS